MDVLVTGGHGTIGTALTDHLDYDFTLLDREDVDGDHPHAEYDTVVADVTDRGAIQSAFESVDAVVHLAGYPRTDGTFEEVIENNVVGTYNALSAAAEAGVDTFVFASSNHVVGQYEVQYAPDIYYGMDLTVDHTAPIRPDSHYGSSKATGEAFGRQFAENYGLSVYALRFCCVRRPEYDNPFGDAEQGVHEGRWDRGSDAYIETAARMQCMWQSRADCAQLVDRCLQDNSVRFDVFYGVSDNERSWFDIDHARAVLGYEPQNYAEEWENPPAEGVEVESV